MTETFTVCSCHRTPELFAEYREEPSALPPGPAFIQYRPWLGAWLTDEEEKYYRQDFGVPDGYVWQDATDHSPAGWVRPKHRDNRTTESGDARRQNLGRTMKED